MCLTMSKRRVMQSSFQDINSKSEESYWEIIYEENNTFILCKSYKTQKYVKFPPLDCYYMQNNQEEDFV